MSLLAQLGFGKSEKVQKGLYNQSIRGMILSPRDEDPTSLQNFARDIRASYPNSIVLFDPQFYACTLLNPKDRNLPRYPYYDGRSGMSRTSFRPTQISECVKDCLEYQRDKLSMLDYWIAPSVLLDGFRDNWSQIGLNFAEESAAFSAAAGPNAKPLLVSVVISEVALRETEAMEEYLDALSTLDVAGFYLLVVRNPGASGLTLEAKALENLLYFVYVLSVINGYEIVSGYTDWYGLLLEAAGAHFTACGWYQNLRNFSMARFLPSSGGRRPRPRYSSSPMLSSVLLYPELQGVYGIGRLGLALSNSPYDSILISDGPQAGETEWTDEISCLAHWHGLSKLAFTSSAPSSIADRLEITLDRIRRAKSLFSQFVSNGVLFEPATGPGHLDTWLEAVESFGRKAGIS